jgi:hypothetical protein
MDRGAIIRCCPVSSHISRANGVGKIAFGPTAALLRERWLL